MREILFRGKRIDNDQWIYGWLTSQHQRGAGGCTISHIQSNVFGVGEHQVSTQTIGQYTGFVDKKKRKIFEGDIVRQHYKVEYVGLKPPDDNIGIVLFVDGAFGVHGFQEKGLCSKSTQFFFQHSIEREVIGNVFDNAELVEELSKRAK